MSAGNAAGAPQAPAMPDRPGAFGAALRRMGIDSGHTALLYVASDSAACTVHGFVTGSKAEVVAGESSVIAQVNVVTPGLLRAGEAALSEAAWARLGAPEGASVHIAAAPPARSFALVRSKIYGQALDREDASAIVGEIARGLYADIEIASFITACAGQRLNVDEVAALTEGMVQAGSRLAWPRTPVADKHCVGGLPGNRTTLVVVPIVAACGLLIPKTSSRAITSPAGTADAMETLAPVTLGIAQMRRVVEREGGCIVWGGAVRLSPADDILIRVARPLDFDGEASLVSSVLSKKIAAGSSHVLIDIPVGPSAKVRTPGAAAALARLFHSVAPMFGLTVRTVETDGRQPVGSGIGPALEARDALAVLRRAPDAPADLRARALMLAGQVLELGGKAAPGAGLAMARDVLDSGAACRKFEAICEAQGGLRTPPVAAFRQELCAARAGRVVAIDNRRLARIAKLAGAPLEAAAGVLFQAPLGTTVSRGQPLLTVHAASPGALARAMEYVRMHEDIVAIGEEA
ncbi:thymidine phosphorylase family protein [Massilia brevitalea]|uniref:thymidine phosphorylase family protein n=1 Tax=Massilia brevitalea TaxID=442526 RepID=UPI00273909D8